MAFFAFAVILALKITLTLSPSWDNGAAKCLVNCWANTVLCSSAILVLMLKDSSGYLAWDHKWPKGVFLVGLAAERQDN